MHESLDSPPLAASLLKIRVRRQPNSRQDAHAAMSGPCSSAASLPAGYPTKARFAARKLAEKALSPSRIVPGARRPLGPPQAAHGRVRDLLVWDCICIMPT